jgi:beta-aspartyl-peptidase (threonine type)
MTYKRHGRVGDSPIVGAGTFANSDCGVSATGHGEFFIRHAVAFDICARMRYLELSVLEAATSVVNGTLVEVGGDGGVIALDTSGKVAMVFNTRNMARAWIDADGTARTAIFGRDD